MTGPDRPPAAAGGPPARSGDRRGTTPAVADPDRRGGPAGGRRALAALALAALLLSAGCNAPGAGGDRRGTYDVPDTVAVETATPTRTAGPGGGGTLTRPPATGTDRVPGLTSETVRNGTVLATAHAAVLSGRALRATRNRTVRAGGRLRRVRRVRAVVSADRKRYRVVVDSYARGRGPRRIDTYANASAAYRRVVFGHNPPETARVTRGPPSVDPTFRAPVASYLRAAAAANATVEAPPRLDSLEYRVGATGPRLARALTLAVGVRVRSATLNATVDAEGYLFELTVTYEAVGADGTVRRVRDAFEFSRVGTATVEEPFWLDAVAGNESPRQRESPSRTDRRRARGTPMGSAGGTQ